MGRNINITVLLLGIAVLVVVLFAVGLFPDDREDVYRYSALAHENLLEGEWDRAIEYYDAVIEAERGSPGIWRNRGYAFLMKAHEGQHTDADTSSSIEKAVNSLETAVERDPQDHKGLYYLGYIHLFMRNDRGSATPYFERAYRIDPQNHEYLIGMGWIRSHGEERSMEEAQAALAYFEESIEMNPTPLAYNGLGYVLNEHIRDYERAIESFEQAIDMDPSYVSPHHNLALAHARRGDKERALEYYENVYELTEEGDTRRADLREELLALDDITIQDDELAQ